jgi:hypothetical protein
MSHVSITKSYAILAGMEGYVRTKHKLRALHETLDDSKEKLLHGRQNDRHVETDAQVSDENAIHKDQAECSSAAVNEESLSVNDKEGGLGFACKGEDPPGVRFAGSNQPR